MPLLARLTEVNGAGQRGFIPPMSGEWQLFDMAQGSQVVRHNNRCTQSFKEMT